MPWVKLDDAAPDHPKLVNLDDSAWTMWTKGLCYCNHYLTDGVVQPGALSRLTRSKDPEAVAEALVKAKLWKKGKDGTYVVHDYHQYQPAKEEVESKKFTLTSVRSSAGRRGGLASAESRRAKAEANEANHQAKTNPRRPDPVPDPPEEETFTQDQEPLCALGGEPEAEMGGVSPAAASSDRSPKTVPSTRVLLSVTATGLVPTTGESSHPADCGKPSCPDCHDASGAPPEPRPTYAAYGHKPPSPAQDHPQDVPAAPSPPSTPTGLRLALDAAVDAGIAASKVKDRGAYLAARTRLTEWCSKHDVDAAVAKAALADLHGRVAAASVPAPPVDPGGDSPFSPIDTVATLAAALWAHKIVRVSSTLTPAGSHKTVLALAEHLAGMRDSSAKPLSSYASAIDRACSALTAESSGSLAPTAWRAVSQRIEQFCFHARSTSPQSASSTLGAELLSAYQAGIRDADPAGAWLAPSIYGGIEAVLAPALKAAEEAIMPPGASHVWVPVAWLRAKACEFRKDKSTTDDAKYTNNWHPKHFVTWLNGANATLTHSSSIKHAVQPIDPEQLKKYQDF